ncbi:Heat shock protein sti1 like protein [Mycena sanguinolenta]|uniref:Heat shock protein sti1 like protein n=1 Tax=Mycena sanguinolenta TaxID=230812 RepID=A0A8H7D0R7_9AGAR|nr:Heat shock protein sti1 like protein [Mycena sanguinolenta]
MRRPLGDEIKGSHPPDWDSTYSARFRRSVQEWPLFPSIAEVEQRIPVNTVTGNHNGLVVHELKVPTSTLSHPASSTSLPSPDASSSKPPPEPIPAPSTGDTETPEADDDETRVKKEAEAAKKAGREAYEKHEFEEAATQLSKAWDLWPQDITFLTNLGAVYFEQGEYDKVIEACEKAVEEGRSLRADHKLIAKAYGRIGSSFQKKGDYALAIMYFQKSLIEHHTPDILNKLRDVERIKADADKQAYNDPEKSALACEEGNVQLRAGNFTNAMKSYTENIKRDPSNALGYKNRAAALPEASKDVDEAIKTSEPSEREYTKEIAAVQAIAREHHLANKQMREISGKKYQQALFAGTEWPSEKEMRNPEVVQNRNDRLLRQTYLQQVQTNPQAKRWAIYLPN